MRWLLCMTLSGCLFAPEVYQARLDELDDDDGDGWSAAGGDCDDEDPTRFPGNAERCDEADNDCDDAVDEAVAAVAGYADLDGDGYGDADAPLTGCAVEGAVADATDCDDADAAVHPGVAETCDEVDQDCDGEVDDDPTDPTAGYLDLDHDGYGDGAAGLQSGCALAGLVDNADDCDDTSAWVYPGAPERLDGAANDCTSPAPVDQVVLAAADLTFTGPARLGEAVWGPGDLDGDGQDDVALATDAAVYVVLGPLGSGDVSAARLQISNRVAGLVAGQDIDGDLVVDLAVGVPGGIAVVDGDTRGDVEPAPWITGAGVPLWLDAAALVGAGDTEVVEWALPVDVPRLVANVSGGAAAVRTDTDGDGAPELWVGRPATGEVVAFVGEGTVTGAEAVAAIVHAEAGSEFGFALAAVGDTDGDGHDDLLVGAPGVDGTGGDDGCAYLFVERSAAADDARASFPGRTSLARAGHALSGPGDLDGDGFADFWIGGPDSSQSSQAFAAVALFLGPQVGVSNYRSRDGSVEVEDAGSLLGWNLASSDGELLLGAPGLAAAAVYRLGFEE